MINTFINLLFNTLYLKFCLIIILILIIYLLKTRFSNLTKDIYSYKINYFPLVHFFTFMYIFFYFGLLFFIRVKYFNKEIDLKPILQLTYKICFFNDLLNNLTMILFICLLFKILILIVIVVHSICTTLIIKEYIYLFHGKEKYHKILQHIKENYLLINFNVFCSKLYLLLHTKLGLQKILNPKLDMFIYRNIQQVISFSINLLPFIILIIILFYDIFYNNQVISINFNRYLFFFLIYTIYKRISIFLTNTNSFVNRMLFNIYYRAHTIKYINIDIMYNNKIIHYVERKLQQTFEDHLNIFNPTFELHVETYVIFTTINGIDYFNYVNDTVTIIDASVDIVNYLWKT